MTAPDIASENDNAGHGLAGAPGYISESHVTSERSEANFPLRDMMMPEAWYQTLDEGIRFAVRVLHAAGFETCQSCQGGKGHSYNDATVDMPTNTNDYEIFGALAALSAYGLPVESVAVVWNVQKHGLINEKIGRITFWRSMEERADEQPMFTWGYRCGNGAVAPATQEYNEK